jgi:UDP:flavonoid glycosyltransferase YjiC (YdhE family)
MVLRDGPEAVLAADCDALLCDEADMGSTVAEYLRVPFVSIAFFPPLIQDDRIPAFCFGWHAGQDPLTRLRNRLGFRLLSRVAAPIYSVVNRQRRDWGLLPLKRPTDALSRVAQITQLPRALEFHVDGWPANLHYTGPFVDARQRQPVAFPWHLLDGRPLIYASLGTLQNGSAGIFRTIAEACAGLYAQLVISLGGGLDAARLPDLPGSPILVPYAPQLELLQRAAVCITHAGLNTVLESLAEGVPLVCLPLGNDQPGVAARVHARGAGLVIPRRRLTVARLRASVHAALTDTRYRTAARTIQSAIRNIDALNLASDIIERTLHIGPKPPAIRSTRRVRASASELQGA